MPFAGILAAIVTPLVAVVVGIRLFGIARRTRRLPELAIATGFLGVYLVGMPVSGLSRIPALVGTLPGSALITLGLSSVSAGILGYYVFTWKTFRPHARWPGWLTAGAAFALVVALVRIARVTLAESAVGSPEMHAASRILLLPMAVLFAWMTVEALLHHANARRRLRIGLADPVVVNRLLLWGIASGACFCTIALTFGVLTGGRAIFADPVFQTTMVASNLLTGACWWLAFLPPRAYEAWLRRGAELPA